MNTSTEQFKTTFAGLALSFSALSFSVGQESASQAESGNGEAPAVARTTLDTNDDAKRNHVDSSASE
jgi:hypothetical protein